MPLANVTVPAFPDVPLALGVPPVPRDPAGLATAVSNLITAAPLMSADAPSITGQTPSAPQWGVFKAGQPILVSDNVLAVEKVKEFRIADYPMEDGSFQTYNKTEQPFDAHVTITKGGSDADRTDFLTTLETVTASLDLYDVVTPEKTYASANIERYDFQRSSRSGVTLLTVTLWLREVRVTATQQFSQTKAPAGADQVNDGNVQAAVPTDDQTAAAGAGGG